MSKQKKRRPAITVITPSIAKRAPMLAEAIGSVSAQTLPAAAHLIGVDHRYEGPGVTINRLVKGSDTEWLSILADDDLYDPDYLQTLAQHTRDADIVLAWYRMEGRAEAPYRGDWDPDRLANKLPTGFAGTFLFRRSLYDRLGGWPTELTEDWTFLMRAVTAGARIVPVYKELWTYRLHDGSMSTIIGELAQGRLRSDIYHLRRFL